MQTPLSGQRVAILGGSSGIGHAVARLALDQGAEVFIGSSNADRVAAAVTRLGDGADGHTVDVLDEATQQAFFDACGAFDHLVYTAADWGAARAPLPLSEMTPEAGEAVFAVRFWGAIRAIRIARPLMPETGSVTITDGLIARRPRKDAALGTAMAGAIEHLATGLAVDLAPLRVNAVCPGLVLSEPWDPRAEERNARIAQMVGEQPIPRGAQARDLAEAYVYLMRASFTTGQVLVVDGGRSLV